MKIRRSSQIELAADPPVEKGGRPVLSHVLIERVEPFEVDNDTYTGRATAADGFMLACVPVQLADDDALGLVPADLIAKARKLVKKAKYGDDEIEIGLGIEHYVMPDNTLVPRAPETLTDDDRCQFCNLAVSYKELEQREYETYPRTTLVDQTGSEVCAANEKGQVHAKIYRLSFPDYRRITPQRNEDKLVNPAFAVNPQLLVTAQKALGADGVHVQHIIVSKVGPTKEMKPGIYDSIPKPQPTSTPLIVEVNAPGAGEPIPPYALVMPMNLKGWEWEDVEDQRP